MTQDKYSCIRCGKIMKDHNPDELQEHGIQHTPCACKECWARLKPSTIWNYWKSHK